MVVGYQAGDYTEQEYVTGGGIIIPLIPTHQVVSIPTSYVPTDDVQTYAPGTWDSAVYGPYARLEVYVQATALGEVLDMFAVCLIPQDQEAFCYTDGDNWHTTSEHGTVGSMVMSTDMHEFSWFIAHGNQLEFLDGYDYSGARFTLAVGRPSAMAFLWRNSDTGYPVGLSDIMYVAAKYKPRYRMVR